MHFYLYVLCNVIVPLTLLQVERYNLSRDAFMGHTNYKRTSGIW